MSDNVDQVNEPNDEPVIKEESKSDAVEQYKNDMFKYKRLVQEREQELQKLKEEQRQKEEEVMQQNNQYKELYERTKGELDELNERHKGFVNGTLEDKRLNAVRECAVKKGINEAALEDLSLLEMDGVVVETTSEGRINVLGADAYVDSLKAKRPHWFNGGAPPKINPGTGDFDGSEKTYSPIQLLELEKKNPSLYREIVTKKRHLIRR